MTFYQPPPKPPHIPNFPEPERKQRGPGVRMLIAGLVMVGVSIIGGIIAIGAFAFSTVNSFASFADSTYEITEHATVNGLGDNQWYIYQDPGAVTSATCTVTDEQGRDVTNHSTNMDISTNDFSYEASQSFASTEQGSYDIECTNYPVVLGGAVPFGGIIGIVISGIVAGLLFLAGAVLTIIGLVQRSRAKNQQGPPYNPGAHPGYGYPQPHQYPGQQPPYS